LEATSCCLLLNNNRVASFSHRGHFHFGQKRTLSFWNDSSIYAQFLDRDSVLSGES
jgi:hypothetical protein